MTTEATVISVENKIAVVESERLSACEGCHNHTNGGCSACTLLGGQRTIQTRAYDGVGVKVGDRVVIESSSRRMLLYAALIFLLPVVVAAAVFCAVAALTPLGEIGSGVVAVLSFFVSLALVGAVTNAHSRQKCDARIIGFANKKNNI